MTIYAFWIDGHRGPEFQILHDKTINEWDRLHAIAPPAPIKPEHEILSFRHLQGLYPCPLHSAIPKNKRQE